MGPHDSDLVIVVEGENAQIVRFLTDSLLDPLEVEKISTQLTSALAAGETGNMIIALDTVTQLSTLMISVLINLRREAQARGGETCLAAVPERVAYLLEVTNLDKAFPTYATTQEAVDALA